MLKSHTLNLSQSHLNCSSIAKSLNDAEYFGTSIWIYPPGSKFSSSPSGSLTTNSLINVATFLFDTTSHCHFLIPSTASGTLTFSGSLTLTWHPSLQLFCCSFLVKNPVSVGRIDPPPSITWHLHMPQVPPPPHAEGRKTPLDDNVESRVDPGETVSSLSLIITFTSPFGVSLSFAIRSITTRSRIIIRKTIML